MITYRLTERPNIVIRIDDAGNLLVVAEDDEAWSAYQDWLRAGNTPEPILRPPPRVELPRPTTLQADPYSDMDAVTKRYLDERIAELRQEINHG